MSGLHETLGAVAFAGNASRPRFAARSHPLPLTAAETVAKDSVLQVPFVCYRIDCAQFYVETTYVEITSSERMRWCSRDSQR